MGVPTGFEGVIRGKHAYRDIHVGWRGGLGLEVCFGLSRSLKRERRLQTFFLAQVMVSAFRQCRRDAGYGTPSPDHLHASGMCVCVCVCVCDRPKDVKGCPAVPEELSPTAFLVLLLLFLRFPT